MNLTILIDVAIGVSLVYLGASLFVTIINEYVGQLLRLRSRQLKQDLAALIDSDDAIEVLRSNPALAPFFPAASDGPAGADGQGKAAAAQPVASYVDTTMLARQLIGGLQKGARAAATMGTLIASIDSMSDCKLKTQLLALSQSTSDNVDKFVQSTSAWIDQSLTMMGEAYKKRMQLISFGLGLGIAVALNVNTLSLASHLYRDADARSAVAGLATGLVQEVSAEDFAACSALDPAALRQNPDCAGLSSLIDGLRQRNATFGELPIGWPPRPVAQGDLPLLVTSVPGWLLTALAISLGASFWFDLLSRLVNLRHGMRKPAATE